MRRLLVAAFAVAALVSGFAVGSGSDTAQAVPEAACKRGSVAAVIGGKRVCLRVGQRCKRALDARYHRYGFHCHATGRLTRALPPPRPVRVSVTGSPQVVFDWTNDRCEDLDLPDLAARAFRDASGSVQLIAAHLGNRRFTGPDLGHLGHDCSVTLASHFNPDPAAYDDSLWIGSTYTLDGSTVYALIHSEYHGFEHPGQCSDNSVLNCWWNAITLAISNDRGRSYSQSTPPGLVASLPRRYVPDSGTYGPMNPTNIVRNQSDGYYYALIYVKQQPAQGENNNINCLIRTKDLADPSSWRAWSGGTSFDTTFIDPYRSRADPAAHLCKGVSTAELGEFVTGSLTYVGPARQWLLVGIRAGGFYYSTSTDLIHWRPSLLFYEATVPWTYQCGGPDPVHYPSVLDPASTSRNYETAGPTAYLYYTQFHTSACQQGLDRDLVRVPITLTK